MMRETYQMMVMTMVLMRKMKGKRREHLRWVRFYQALKAVQHRKGPKFQEQDIFFLSPLMGSRRVYIDTKADTH